MERSFRWLLPVTVLLLATCAESAPRPSRIAHWQVTLARTDEPGVPFVLEGRVMAANGPMHDVLVHVYHADDRGHYAEPGASRTRLDGMLRTNVLGEFRIRTVLPGLAEGIPHVHFELAAPGGEYRTVSLSLARSTGAGSDSTFERLPQMLTLPTGHWAYARRDTSGAFHCRWDIPFSSLPPVPRPATFQR